MEKPAGDWPSQHCGKAKKYISSAGAVSIHVETRCATQHVTLRHLPSASTADGSSQAGTPADKALQQGLHGANGHHQPVLISPSSAAQHQQGLQLPSNQQQLLEHQSPQHQQPPHQQAPTLHHQEQQQHGHLGQHPLEDEQHQQAVEQHLRMACPVRCQLALDCLVVSVWDDERGHLLRGRPPSVQGEQAELCCLYLDSLTASCSRLPSSGMIRKWPFL